MRNYSRRRFIQTSLAGAAGLSMFPFMKGCSTPPSDQIRIGVIGLGRQAISLINGFHQNPGVKVVAGADVYGRKRERFEMMIRQYQEAAEYSNIEATATADYQDMLNRDDIDVIVIATPDHWHAIQAIEACQAGKDIYLEKPVTLTIKEGIEVVKAVRENDIVLGVGSQQRSDPNFQHAVKLVRENRLGDLAHINAWVGGPAVPYDLPEEEVPSDLDWDKWLGPNQYVHYNPDLNPPISLDPVQHEQIWGGWRWYKETGGGLLTDWGAHMFDVVQWALDKDDSGPVEIIPAGHSGTDYIDFVYEDGLVMSNAPFTDDEMQGVRFEGSDGWIEVHRGHFRASDDELLPPVPEVDDDVEYEQASPHLVDFIGAVRSRQDPIAPIEAGHRTGTIGTLGNIATVLDRPLKWNPDSETFVDDAEADGHLHRDYRDGYSL
ncbi:MAG: Gfo/Idh/MocA family oxidoreductase [Balneolaceae bacterium]|nr:Gfo/Idh/MocA family oxidoreductase [Balneolaceae bacterium]